MNAVLAVLNGKVSEFFRPIFPYMAVFGYLLFNTVPSLAGHVGVTGVGVSGATGNATVKPENANLSFFPYRSVRTGEQWLSATIPYSCPQDVYVSCAQYTGNPDDYGAPTPLGNYQITILSYTVENHLNGCGIGYLIRRWVIQTVFGQSTCTQRITISGAGSFGYHNIDWPDDYDLGTCIGSTHPDDLPDPYSRPRWTSPDCAMIGTSYHDQVVQVGGGGCKKVLRTWKVMDWCQYQPNVYPPVGIWTHVQVIKLSDSERPVFTFCPQDITVSTDQDCSGLHVTIQRAEATDNCTANVTITNNHNAGGANASGRYPVGTTTVVFTAKDDCGNTATCSVRVTVRDQKIPTAIAHHGLVAVLMNMSGGPAITIDAKLFNRGSSDNCTPANRLRFELEPNTFTCEDLGRNEIKFIVYDESGNSDFVYTYVIIQENMGMCPDSLGGAISGLVTTEGAGVLPGFRVEAVSSRPVGSTTNTEGSYKLKNLKKGEDYFVRPVKQSGLQEGVDIRDLVMIRKHILGIERLNSPYKILAADINKSGNISVQDYIQLRMLMHLGVDQFPGLESWRFVDKRHVFERPEDPFADQPVFGYNISGHGKQNVKLDFIGIKLGDVDGSYYDEVQGLQSRSEATMLMMEDRQVSAGSVVSVPVYASAGMSLMGLQVNLLFDPAYLAFRGCKAGSLSVTPEDLYTGDLDEGRLGLIWDAVAAVSVETEEPLFYIEFEGLTQGQIAQYVRLRTDARQQCIDRQLQLRNIELGWRAGSNVVTPVHVAELIAHVFPNPAADQVNIDLHMVRPGTVDIRVLALSGATVYHRTQDLPAGGSRIDIQRDQMGVPAGAYLIEIYTEGTRVVKKLLLR